MAAKTAPKESTEAAIGDLPEAELLRKRLRIAISKARHDAGLTQKAVAKKLDWSVSKIVRIEQGLVPVAPSDVRVMLGQLGVTDDERVEELVQLARRERDAKSWAEYDEVLPEVLRQMIGQEGAATSIWKYEPSVVPGYFQTGSYATNLLTALGLSSREVALLAEVRTKRQTILDLGSSGPELHVVIGEAALLRPVGDHEVMREQIKHINELSTQPGISISLLPFSAGPHLGMGKPFTILQFNDPEIYDALYLEDGEKRSTSSEDPEAILRHLELFNQLQTMTERTGTFEEHGTRVIHDLYESPSVHQ